MNSGQELQFTNKSKKAFKYFWSDTYLYYYILYGRRLAIQTCICTYDITNVAVCFIGVKP